MNKIFNKLLLGILCASLIIVPYTKVYAANDKNDENEESTWSGAPGKKTCLDHRVARVAGV